VLTSAREERKVNKSIDKQRIAAVAALEALTRSEIVFAVA